MLAAKVKRPTKVSLSSFAICVLLCEGFSARPKTGLKGLFRIQIQIAAI